MSEAMTVTDAKLIGTNIVDGTITKELSYFDLRHIYF